ncbi:Protein kinase-like domain protein [Penicillium digitatum]|uniref:Protein kinase-like domain protein n=1 Tax=Penicillium digitatum TaxID=36651 RepID=A0A7T6XVZ4_PENDI|nr:Protein kinase-like domain protein [Penicillium digitatum]
MKMSIYLWNCFSAVRAAWKFFIEGTFGIFSGIIPLFIKAHPSNSQESNDLESNNVVGVASRTSDHVTYTIRPLFQSDLKISSRVVAFSNNPGATPLTATGTTMHQIRFFTLAYCKMNAIDTDQPEGIFLRRYKPLPEGEVPAQPTRIRWYCDIADALCHLHKLGIAHGDVRIDNVLLDNRGSAILCDFSAASPFGYSNLVISDLPLPVNGPSPNLSEATDMFAMASLLFQVEHGIKPELSVDSDGELILPSIQTNHLGIDAIIRNAWLKQYSSTSEMLQNLYALDAQTSQAVYGTQIHSEPIASLRERIKVWRNGRENSIGRVLDGILSGDQLQVLADCYDLDRDAELRFTSYSVPMHEN